MTCSTTAWSRCSASTTASSSVRLVRTGKWVPVGPQLGLRTDQARAPDDQPSLVVGCLGDLRLAVVGVVDALPGVLVDLLDGGADGLGHPHRDRVLPAGLLQALEHPRVPDSRVGPEQLGAGGARALDASDELVDEALDALLGVRRSLPEADVQHLARVRACGEDRVVAEHAGVAVGGALLQPAADLADEAVDVDDEPLGAGTGAGVPGALKRPAEQRVELADMPEGKRAQPRPERRGRRDPATRSRRARPAPSRPQSSMLSAPRIIA